MGVPSTEAYAAAEHPSLVFPVAGLGTGGFGLGADGSLGQWQLHNLGNHRGDLPHSFLALRVARVEPPLSRSMVLQAPAPEPTAAWGTTDAYRPRWQRDVLARFGSAAGATMRHRYPAAEVDFDLDLPVTVTLRAENPLLPTDSRASAWPIGQLTLRLTNTGPHELFIWSAASAQNAVGHDGALPIDGVRGAGYGGNVNRVRRHQGWTQLVLENPSLDPGSPGYGSMVVACDQPDASVLPCWSAPEQLFAYLDSRTFFVHRDRWARASHLPDAQLAAPMPEWRPSPVGSTWNGSVVASHLLQPGETRSVRFLIAWHFPNRYANFEQWGPVRAELGPTRFWLGNAYAQQWPDAIAVADDAARHWEVLEQRNEQWLEVVNDLPVPEAWRTRLAAQPAIARSPVCFRSAEGTFIGFEGVNGASTTSHAGDLGGSCAANCTHVWNYEQALARFFADCELSMRDTEFDVAQTADGAVGHRVVVPTYLPQPGDHIGGPDTPALDGMLGVFLKTLRELRHGSADLAWLTRRRDPLRRLMDHLRCTWDPDATGVLRGVQPSTHDIDLNGTNPYTGFLWLAALRAAARLEELLDDQPRAGELRQLAERGARAYSDLMWNGEYFEQVPDTELDAPYQWGSGCLSDQLLGQWWAHLLGLGPLVETERIRAALRAVHRHNWRREMGPISHDQRLFAEETEPGLLMCTWPRGGRPELPTRYCDEVWTGSEYQVAALCWMEGLGEQATEIAEGIWRRHDGRRRNPYNEIECGDHYARAMAGWSLLEARCGLSWDALTGTLTFVPGDSGTIPVLAATGWGLLRRGARPRLQWRHGTLPLRRLVCVDGLVESATASDGWQVSEALAAGDVFEVPGSAQPLSDGAVGQDGR